MGDRVTFQVAADSPQTLLVRSFLAPISDVFDAWTNGENLRQWYGPHVTRIVECFMDIEEGGPYRITMETPDGVKYPLFGTVHNAHRPFHVELRMDLSEHPEEFVRQFRPKGSPLEDVPIEWYCEITFRQMDEITVVSLLTTYPIVEDRDVMIAMGGDEGWNESFERLDSLLAFRK